MPRKLKKKPGRLARLPRSSGMPAPPRQELLQTPRSLCVCCCFDASSSNVEWGCESKAPSNACVVRSIILCTLSLHFFISVN
jgi:hypothetical protein